VGAVDISFTKVELAAIPEVLGERSKNPV